MERLSYPRPDFIRKNYILLDGKWNFSFDAPVFDKTIYVPFSPETEMSGIGDCSVHESIHYRKEFEIDESFTANGRHVVLTFLAVDYEAHVYLNGIYIGKHRGGYTPFSFDITSHLKKENTLVLEVFDSLSPYQRRGKQSWKNDPFACWYERNSGIWQSVYIESVGDIYLKNILFSPSFSDKMVSFELMTSSDERTEVELEFSSHGIVLGRTSVFAEFSRAKGSFSFHDMDVIDDISWSPSRPNLIDVKCTVKGETWDDVYLYFGLRDIDLIDGVVYINRVKTFMRLVLDQGLWKESLLTPPSVEDLRKDIKIAMEIGFNGARKHQKIESPAYYTLCDELGFLLWEEFPSNYSYSSYSLCESFDELDEMVRRDYNHPSVIAWVPLNESWGISSIFNDVREREFSRALLHYLKAIDSQRLVSINDGWEIDGDTDIIGIHDYRFSSDDYEKYSDIGKILDENYADERMLLLPGSKYSGQAVVLSEFGGIAFDDEKSDTWGYFGKISSTEQFVARIKKAVNALEKSNLAGYCYTQLTDAFQETNGLVTMEREYKIPLKTLKSIFCSDS